MKTTTALVLVIQALTLSLAVASEGGGGHNGPDFKGTSIDLTFDRTLQRGDMEKVIDHCLSITLSDVLQTVWKKGTVELTDIRGQDGHARTLPEEISYMLRGSRYVYGRDLDYDETYSSSATIELDGNASKKSYRLANSTLRLHFSASPISDSSKPDSDVFLNTRTFPFVEFQSDKNYGYTDLGVKVLTAEPVTEIKLYDQPGVDSYPLYNGDHKLDYTVNGRKYVDCVKASL